MSRTITDEQYKRWLSDTTSLRVILGEFDAYSNGNVVTHRIGTEYFTTAPTDTPPNTIYTGALIGEPTFTSRATESYGGSTFISFGSIIIDNTDGRIDHWISESFAGRLAVLKIGSPDWNIDDYRVIFNGVSDRLDIPNDGSLEIFIKDRQRLLDAPIQTNRMNQVDDEAGVEIPLCFGECYNVSPVLDAENERRYVINDGPIEAIDTVYVNGEVTTALTKSLAEGYFTLNSEPDGTVTADVKGDNSAGYKNTIPGIAELMVSRVLPAVAPGSTERLVRDWGTAVSGVYITQRTNLLDALDGLGVGFRYGFDRDGEFSFSPLEEPGTPVVTIDDIETHGDLGIIKGDVPVWKSTIGYKRNWTTQSSVSEGTPDVHRNEVSKDYTLFTSSEGPEIKVECVIAQEPDFVRTPFINATDAKDEADRLLALYGKQRFVATVSAYSRPLTLSIGDTIRLQDGRFGLQDGADFVVVGMTEHLIDSKVDLELWR
jgi:hypothetical protein